MLSATGNEGNNKAPSHSLLKKSHTKPLLKIKARATVGLDRKDDWSELLKGKDLNSWTRVKLQECYHEVRQEDDQRKSGVQQIRCRRARTC